MNDNLTHLILIVLIAVVSVLVYFETTELGFVADDARLIFRNTDFLQDLGNLKTTFVSPLPVKTYEPLPFYRPIISLTYFLNYHFSRTIQGYHLFNLAVHTLNTILLYLLIFLLFKNIPLSLFSSLFFAAHPLHLSSVVWISGRTDLIACFFFLLTLILFFKAKGYKKSPPPLLWAGASVSYVLCLFSKETALVLPLFLFIWDYLSKKEPIQKKIIPYIPLAAIAVLYVVWRLHVLGNLGTGEPYSSSGLFKRILTVFPIYFYYFKEMILPLQFNFSPQVATINSIFSLRLLGSLIVFAVVLGLGLSLRKRSKEVWFGILWILVTLLPVLNVVPLYASVKEWWAYIPSIGFCIILGKLAVEAIKWEKKIFEITLSRPKRDVESPGSGQTAEEKKVSRFKRLTFPDRILLRANHLLALFFALVLIFYAFNIRSQAKVFRKEIYFWRAAAQRSPHDGVVHNAYGVFLQQRGVFRFAEREFKKAIEAEPNLAEPHNHLGMLYHDRGQNDSALVEIEEAVRLDLDYADAYANLGYVYADEKDFCSSVDALQKALKLDPHNFAAQRNLGMVYSYAGQFSEAIIHLEKALELTRSPRDIQEIEGIIEHFKTRQQQ
jgi:tetratricopeptide (TPR) repeat protein